LKRRAIFIRPASAGLASISGNQFKSAFISVELLVAAMLHFGGFSRLISFVVAGLNVPLR
jgi:hypothetical protein